VDPKAGKYVFQSPFAYADNNPICKMDYNGEGTGEGGGEQPSTPTQHTIGKGDSFWKLENKYNLVHGTLQKLNPGMDAKNLKIGSKINLGDSSSSNLQIGSIGNSGEGEDFGSGIKSKPQTTSVMNSMQFATNSALFGYMGNILKEGTFLTETKEVDITMNHFKANTGSDLNRPGLAKMMLNTDPLKNTTNDISIKFKQKMTAFNGDFSKISIDVNRPNFTFSDSPTLKAIVGGTQQLDIFLTSINIDNKARTYSANLSLNLYDDFGVSESDVTNPSLAALWGQNALGAFWVLQHQRGIKPFRHVFNFNMKVNGTF